MNNRNRYLPDPARAVRPGGAKGSLPEVNTGGADRAYSLGARAGTGAGTRTLRAQNPRLVS